MPQVGHQPLAADLPRARAAGSRRRLTRGLEHRGHARGRASSSAQSAGSRRPSRSARRRPRRGRRRCGRGTRSAPPPGPGRCGAAARSPRAGTATRRRPGWRRRCRCPATTAWHARPRRVAARASSHCLRVSHSTATSPGASGRPSKVAPEASSAAHVLRRGRRRRASRRSPIGTPLAPLTPNRCRSTSRSRNGAGVGRPASRGRRVGGAHVADDDPLVPERGAAQQRLRRESSERAVAAVVGAERRLGRSAVRSACR